MASVTRWKRYPKWVWISVLANGILVVVMLITGSAYAHHWLPRLSIQSFASILIPISTPVVEERLSLNYSQWVDLLAQEADAEAQKQANDLYILLGDSLTSRFPPEFLPVGTWLNQGIPGDRSVKLLQRLELLDKTQPQAIFLMIGINDLQQGVRSKTIVANQRLTIQYLRRVHPQTVVVVQSILPHGAEAATRKRREQFREVSNTSIQELNQKLADIATQEGVVYLDLYSLFANERGNLRTELSTDGLHLNSEGYKLWRLAIDICKQLEID